MMRVQVDSRPQTQFRRTTPLWAHEVERMEVDWNPHPIRATPHRTASNAVDPRALLATLCVPSGDRLRSRVARPQFMLGR